ncbi:MAG: hypothetical protein ABIH26_04635, partial [Candidatus Eisenbacteria bacterium]
MRSKLNVQSVIVSVLAVGILVWAAVTGIGRSVGNRGAGSSDPSSVSEGAREEESEVRSGGKNRMPEDLRTFVRYQYDDPQAGMEAFRLLIPKGWRAEGGITWSANPALPAQSSFRFHEPGGTAEFDVFPTQSYFWTDNALFLGTNPPGTLRFGTLVASPVDLGTAFRSILLPQLRGRVSGLRIVEEKEVPELAELA